MASGSKKVVFAALIGNAIIAIIKFIVALMTRSSAALAGLVVAFVGVLLVDITGIPYFDAAASIVIGLILASVAVFLANEMRKLLIGESIEADKLTRIKTELEGFGEVDKLGRVNSMYIGPRHVLVALDVDFHDHITAGELESVIDRMETKVREILPEKCQIFIEAEKVTKPLSQ